MSIRGIVQGLTIFSLSMAVGGCGVSEHRINLKSTHPSVAQSPQQERPDSRADAEYPPLGDISLSAQAFNVSRDEPVRLFYSLAHPEIVTVRVYDIDGGLVRTLLNAGSRDAGEHEQLWDGRDVDRQLVPDEAYTFTVETASGNIYDPTTFSGGVVGDITQVLFDAEAGTVVYRLPAASQVLVRLGVHNGPMLKTLVDWKPRVAGAITEYWDGYDQDGLIHLREHPDFRALITYATLPDATVIVYGNDQETYRSYKLGQTNAHPQKPDRPRSPDPEGRLLAQNLVPPAWARAPRVHMSFPQYGGKGIDIPEVGDVVNVHVDIDPSDRDQLLQEQFEVILFVDNVFVAEAERGYLPFNWQWELHQFPPGEHVLTVNISSFKGQVGVASRKVRVVR